LGVPVAAYGQDRFPAFYTPDSGFDAPLRLDSPAEAARMLRAAWGLGLQNGAVIGNPIPAAYAIPRHKIDAAIDEALSRAAKEGVSGKSLTPYLLAAVTELTGGESLRANKQLVYNNASLAAEIAVAYAALA
ncbi:MAG: pseudouridine-5'-phosphate glycosidase, partial [Spirochaetaceae bacterium]|nr:pseudouridine-5'-phosphate glycosidase [Spirochaetaceae bacterium]